MNTRKYNPEAEFKQKYLALMEKVALPRNSNQARFGRLKDSVIIHTDLTKPVSEKWDANK